ncbi:MAG: HAD family phosphatase [Alphaproteobacteria bacterium]|nr:HAD family phosphatase [Alphaproteobacteria bacterium]
MIKVVLFDLGGVLVRLVGGVEQVGRWLNLASADEVWKMWLESPWVRRHQLGHCGAEEFAAGLVRDHGLAVSPEEFLASFRGWAVGALPGAADLVRSVRPGVRRGCLINTNALHWEAWGDEVDRLFDDRFLSFRMGRMKPDPDTYRFVAGELGVAPSEILFLDDNAINVAGARAVGFDAHRVEGVAAARGLLVERGLLID